jgi:hypothetical protein
MGNCRLNHAPVIRNYYGWQRVSQTTGILI